MLTIIGNDFCWLLPTQTGATQMTNRTARKSTALPVMQDAVYVRELPGAAFFGVPRSYTRVTDRYGVTHEVDATSITAIDRESLLYAARMQRIRREYETDGDEDLLWLDCQAMGFESREISQFVANPAKITSCGYYGAGALSQRC
jgi:hypothetical protein